MTKKPNKPMPKAYGSNGIEIGQLVYEMNDSGDYVNQMRKTTVTEFLMTGKRTIEIIRKIH